MLQSVHREVVITFIRTMNANLYRWMAILLLAFNIGGAVYGGFSLVNDPTGSELGLSQDLLSRSPFNDYKIPGMILLAVNGAFCLVVLLYTLFRWKRYETLLIIQGMLLTGWIVIQMLMINMIFILHFILGACGVYFFFAGLMLLKHTDNNGSSR